MECTVWTKQCDHVPWSSLVKAMVLVVMACSSFRPIMAPPTPLHHKVYLIAHTETHTSYNLHIALL